MSREPDPLMAECLEEAAIQWGTLMEKGWPPSDECRTFTEADKGCIATIAAALYQERCRIVQAPPVTGVLRVGEEWRKWESPSVYEGQEDEIPLSTSAADKRKP